MDKITFIDVEVNPSSEKILSIGAIENDGTTFLSKSEDRFVEFLSNAKFICGHNILEHDLKYLSNPKIKNLRAIDTLFLSPLLFPKRPYHALVKDDKLQTDDVNNPISDSICAKDLFYEEVEAFKILNKALKKIFYSLLKEQREFENFFYFLNYTTEDIDLEQFIKNYFKGKICENINIKKLISEDPVPLAYSLALINCEDKYSITPPWVSNKYPKVQEILHFLRNQSCSQNCAYCRKALNIYEGLEKYFGFNSYKTYEGEPLQEKAVKVASENKSLLAIFPTGGGKSLTFQVPALMSGENMKGLTVVISPLQSLMKDQVDNLEKEFNITDAVTINGLLSPLEKKDAMKRVSNGSASILYISPESLRYRTMKYLLLKRNVVRFVIDEAHCFSAWGHDFRPDYLYIGKFIKAFQKKKGFQETIPVSCFTATAKKAVIEDITNYFKKHLSIDLEIFATKEARKNLKYKVFIKNEEEDKYNEIRNLLEQEEVPTIIYVSRTKKAREIAERLTRDGFEAKPYHGKMEREEKTKNQDAFMSGEILTIVATSAFGMGVDKKDVKRVIHYEIPDSLENYMQESGRAGRDPTITADCYILFNEDDLSKHFNLFNQTKLDIKEIQQIWRAIKEMTKFRTTVSNSALEIARKAGWDERVSQIETKVVGAIAALEEAKYLKRTDNTPRVYANSITPKNAQEAIEIIESSNNFSEQEKQNSIRIIKKLIASKTRGRGDEEEPEARVDYIADQLGLKREDVIKAITLLREEKILANIQDLTAYVPQTKPSLKTFIKIENYLLEKFEEEEKTFKLKELNEEAQNEINKKIVNIKRINAIINFWKIKKYIKVKRFGKNREIIKVILNENREILREKFSKRHELVEFIMKNLEDKALQNPLNRKESQEKEGCLIEFSTHELKEEFEKENTLFNTSISIEDIEASLLFLGRIDALQLEGGFLVIYNKLGVDRLELNPQIQYKQEDYTKLQQFYSNKVQQIHIVGEYAKMLKDYQKALKFVDDYFQLDYDSFLNKYFPGDERKKELRKTVTPEKFKELFGELSERQMSIINDNSSQYIVVAAGPGSGKTKILVHKLASLLLMEDIRQEQLLMLTFSRAAATEFKKRLLDLIGNAAYYVQIKTFHSYCFDLLGRAGNLEKSENIIKEAIEKIESDDVEKSWITKTVLVIDEAQDMDEDEFKLVNTLIEKNEEMRVIAVGDDDQNIYEFRGSSSKYLYRFIKEKNAKTYELLENYRSKNNLVEFTNQYVTRIKQRLKKSPICANKKDCGHIRVTIHRSSELTKPIVTDIYLSTLKGTTCVLTRTNYEALQVMGLLLKYKLPAQLIQINEDFNLYDIEEIRFFFDRLSKTGEKIYQITDDAWKEAKQDLENKFKVSNNLNLCKNLIKDFEEINKKKKYISDLEVFIKESKIEDFFHESIGTIFVSTMHKAKGKEFDNVFLMLKDFFPKGDEDIRPVYVAMTRAKENLSIHSNNNDLSNIIVNKMKLIQDDNIYPKPEQILINLNHRDVFLSYFESKQEQIHQLQSGDKLIAQNDGCLNQKGDRILKFSKQFLERMKSLENYGYKLNGGEINFILYWKGEEMKKEIKIILPRLVFEREGDI